MNGDRIRKQKSVEAQRRYRKKLKEGTTNKESAIKYDKYKKSQAEYMMKYRAKKKIEIASAYAEQDPSPNAESKLEKKVEKINKKVPCRNQDSNLGCFGHNEEY